MSEKLFLSPLQHCAPIAIVLCVLCCNCNQWSMCTVHCVNCVHCAPLAIVLLWSRWWDRHNCHGRLLSNYGEEPTRRLTLLVTTTQFLKCTCNMSPMTLPLFKSSLSAMHYSLIKELQWVTTQFLKCTNVTDVTAHMQNCGVTNISSL